MLPAFYEVCTPLGEGNTNDKSTSWKLRRPFKGNKEDAIKNWREPPLDCVVREISQKQRLGLINSILREQTGKVHSLYRDISIDLEVRNCFSGKLKMTGMTGI